MTKLWHGVEVRSHYPFLQNFNKTAHLFQGTSFWIHSTSQWDIDSAGWAGRLRHTHGAGGDGAVEGGGVAPGQHQDEPRKVIPVRHKYREVN